MNAGRRLFRLLPVAALLGAPSCFTDNPAAYTGILGPARWAAGGESATGDASTLAGGDAAVGVGGGAPTGGSDAGIPVTDAGDNPPVDPNFSPACFQFLTRAGEEILKGTPCTSSDPKLCYRPCGPNQVGWKTETCLAGVYAEGDCTFPTDKDYSCYSIPDPIDEAACGLTAPPSATAECAAPSCMTCNFGGFYQDTGDNVKEGFCVCRDPDTAGVRRWTCASTTAWPCPFSQGC